MSRSMRFGWILGMVGLLGLIPACDDEGGGGRPVVDGGADGADGGEDCSPGTEGCRCLMDGTCRLPQLTCSAGYCRDATEPCDPLEERCPPAEPVCFTPCRADRVDPDGVRLCAPDGLMRGCLPGASCVQGTCTAVLPPNAQSGNPGQCGADADCADFQVCLRGQCYSECEVDSQCGGKPGNPRRCDLRVCREVCASGQPCTDPGTFCDTDNLCRSLVPPDPVAAPPSVGAWALSASTLTFTASSTERAVELRNLGLGPVRLTVRKAEQTTVAPDGRVERITAQPLPWLTLDGQRTDAIELEIPEGEVARLEIGGAGDHSFSRWSGRLEISGEGLPKQALRLVYSVGLTGRWTGTAFAFGNFEGGAEIEAWAAGRSNPEPAIPNAFLRVWAAYRNGRVPQPELGAILQATLTGSWDQPRVRALCQAAGFDADTVCAPFNNAAGVIPYTAGVRENPVPSGVVETDLSIEVRAVPCEAGACAEGRVDSAVALQYPGDPAVRLVFAGDPDGCEREDAVQGCVTSLDGFDVEVLLGGRLPGADCPEGFEAVTQPWLVGGFWSASGPGERVECRDRRVPFAQQGRNPGFAEANPVADGQVRRRRLSLVDGLLVEQNVMTLLLREAVELPGEDAPLVSYQFVMLTREPADPADLRPTPTALPAVAPLAAAQGPRCAPELLAEVTGGRGLDRLSPRERQDLAAVLLTGAAVEPEPLPPGQRVHSLCIWEEQTGNPQATGVGSGLEDAIGLGGVVREVINAGPDDNRLCFPGAEVIYFSLPAGVDPTAWDCNATFQRETCLTELKAFAERTDLELHLDVNAAYHFAAVGENVAVDLVARCADGSARCDGNRFQMTAGKTFSLADGAEVFYAPLDEVVARAFRYKTRFVSRAGTNLGFSPTVCRSDVRPDPYCFDPEAIDQVRARVDCALALLPQVGDARPLVAGLQRQFGSLNAVGDDPILSRGFEELYAELLIMLGDEALTRAYTTRYALAGSGEAFEGSQFELEGIDISGVAGNEMAQLHRAVQTYDLVLDRFFRLVPLLSRNAREPNPQARYVSERTVTGWMERVIRASTQRARAQGEIARRYQTFSRPELAVMTARRAYARAHQEGQLLTTLINRIADQVAPERRDAVRRSVAQAQVRYRVALLGLAEVHTRVSSDVDFFGFTGGYVPFPALDEGDVNGFEVMLARAMDRLELAAADETRAINERRAFDNEEAAFRAELVTQRNRFEEQLGLLCGTFVGDDGRTYPAIPRYADRMPEPPDGDPCGIDNGALWNKAGDLQGMELAVTRVRQEARNALTQMQETFAEVEERCGLINEDVAVFLASQGVIDAIEGGIDGMGFTLSILDKLYDFMTEASNRVNDVADESSPIVAATKIIGNAAWGASAVVHLAATTTLEATILTSQAEIRRKARAYEARTIGRECEYLRRERAYQIRAQERDFLLIKLDVLNAIWDVDVQLSDLRGMLNERNRIEAEWADAEQLAVEAAAAQSDPTRRIYKNDAIRNAEASFEVAQRAAWQATLTYEYYTGSSYPWREALFLARLVERGDINLRRYMEDLREAFYDFEQQFGNPDTRVARVSVCDDVFQIPRLGPNGEILSAKERVRRCRAALKDPGRLDRDGALRLPFSTDLGALSPRTVNHKILFVEAGLLGQLGGDGVARIYLEAGGTGLVTGTDGARRFYTFPPRTAVINPFFSGAEGRRFGQDADGNIAGPTRSIYRSYRFRERPFVQSSWSLVFDQRAERVNRDIDLGALTDLVVDIYYTDFTREAL